MNDSSYRITNPHDSPPLGGMSIRDTNPAGTPKRKDESCGFVNVRRFMHIKKRQARNLGSNPVGRVTG